MHARTDRRDPANTGSTPAWLIELRNGLRAISEQLEVGDDRHSRLAFRAARERIEQGLVAHEEQYQARVEHVLIDPDRDFPASAGMIPPSVGAPADLLGERAVESAIAGAAQVTALETDALRHADGMAALLRY